MTEKKVKNLYQKLNKSLRIDLIIIKVNYN